jgi:RimJ/RimL family protein N-acetyltransferase
MPELAGPDDAPLSDAVVRLRPFTTADVDAYADCLADPLTRRWWTGGDAQPQVEAAVRIERAARGRADGSRDFLAVEWVGDPDRLVGRVSLRYESAAMAHPAAELGFETHPEFRGRGIATRAARLLCRYGFDRRGVCVVRWRSFAGNWASRRVAWRVGFRFEGLQRRALLDRAVGGSYRDGWSGSLVPGEPMRPRSRWLDAPTLTGTRVRLRRLRDNDVDRIVEGATDADTQRWLPLLPNPYRPTDAESFLESTRADAAAGTDVTWALADPADGRLIGCLGLNVDKPEIGYWVHPRARGCGVATEAARLALTHAFGPLGLHRVSLRAAVPNLASRRVAEKAGMRLVGILRADEHLADGRCDVALYEALPAETSEQVEGEPDHRQHR